MSEQDRSTDTGIAASMGVRFLLTWIATGMVIYGLLSGMMIWLLPFSVFNQYSVLLHSAVGVVATAPVVWLVYGHWQRRKAGIDGRARQLALAAVAVLGICLVSGLFAVANGLVGGSGNVLRAIDLLHLVSGLTLGLVTVMHVAPVFTSDRNQPATARRPVRKRYAAISVSIAAALLGAGWLLAAGHAESPALADLPADYDLPHGIERPFWPSRARIDGRPDAAKVIRPSSVPRAETCGASGCHSEIYAEWRPSAHGYAAKDPLFLKVQALLAADKGVSETRACAGCHDPLALLAGTRSGATIEGDHLVSFDGVSCAVCHGITEGGTEGNGNYALGVPEPYLFAGSAGAMGAAVNRYLIRRYPEQHRENFKRPLYRSSEFCAVCHKQVPLPGVDTDIGLAQEQNEYDSWLNGRWYHEGDPDKTVDCRECHMPLVESSDPASGDVADAYRSRFDGKHRSHRVLASNMYVPAILDLPGGDQQADLTVAWLRGEIDIPEIEHKWVSGPVVDIEIVAPPSIRPGELVNISLHLHNNKTGHDFPAGPLDLLESWVELVVEDDLGRVLMTLGQQGSRNPAIDAPVIYKADWYDRRGLPVEWHNLWDVVGASFRHTIGTGDVDVIDVPFTCPGIGRPRISESYSETGAGERKSDVVFSVADESVSEFRVTARLLYRKANPEFLSRVYSIGDVPEAPVIELVRATRTITVEAAR